MWRVKLSATPYLNVRCKPNGDIIGRFAPGRQIEVQSISDGWAKVLVADTVIVTVSATFIEQAQEPTPEPQPDPEARQRVGLHFHTNNERLSECIELISDLAQAKKPLPMAVVINNAGLVQAIKRLSPDTFVVFRGGVVGGADNLPLVKDDAAANMQAGRQRFKDRYQACPADAWQIANEHYAPSHANWQVTAMAWFYVGAMYEAEAAGVKITVGDFSTGTPEPEQIDLLDPMLQKAERDGHYLGYHSYAKPDSYNMNEAAEWYTLRFEKIVADYPALGIVLHEMGGFHNNGSDPMALVKQFSGMIARRRNVKGAAVFTAMAGAPWKDNGFNFDPYLGEFKRWHLSQ